LSTGIPATLTLDHTATELSPCSPTMYAWQRKKPTK
jgi:hypothetical protein